METGHYPYEFCVAFHRAIRNWARGSNKGKVMLTAEAAASEDSEYSDSSTSSSSSSSSEDDDSFPEDLQLVDSSDSESVSSSSTSEDEDGSTSEDEDDQSTYWETCRSSLRGRNPVTQMARFPRARIRSRHETCRKSMLCLRLHRKMSRLPECLPKRVRIYRIAPRSINQCPSR